MVQVKLVTAMETTVPGKPVATEVRTSVVESVLAGLLAAQLSAAEFFAVVAAIHDLVARETGARVVVAATAVSGERVSSWVVQQDSLVPALVASTVERLVRSASPELWSAIRAALDDEQGTEHWPGQENAPA